jgi:transporter family-2 protein
MILLFYAACLLLGFLMTFHVSMNARVGTLSGDPLFANLIFWLLGAAVAVISYLAKGEKTVLSRALEVPIWLYAAGMIGAGVSLGVILMIPRVGIVGFTVLILIGQLICSGVMGATGCLEDSITPVGPTKLAGYLLLAGGGYLVITR